MLTEANIREWAKADESEVLEFKRTTGLRKEAAHTSNSTSNWVHFQAAANGLTWERRR